MVPPVEASNSLPVAEREHPRWIREFSGFKSFHQLVACLHLPELEKQFKWKEHRQHAIA